MPDKTGSGQPSDPAVGAVASISFGATSPGDWQQYTGGCGIFVKVDTSSVGFSSTPRYVTALHGTSSHWATTGASCVYDATPNGFTIYIRWSDGHALTPADAQGFGWQVQWIAVIG